MGHLRHPAVGTLLGQVVLSWDSALTYKCLKRADLISGNGCKFFGCQFHSVDVVRHRQTFDFGQIDVSMSWKLTQNWRERITWWLHVRQLLIDFVFSEIVTKHREGERFRSGRSGRQKSITGMYSLSPSKSLQIRQPWVSSNFDIMFLAYSHLEQLANVIKQSSIG